MENIEQNDKNPAGFKFKDFLWGCLSKWYWFVISLAICCGYAVYQVAKTPRMYTSSATLVIKDGSYADEQSSMFSDMSSFNRHINLNNEMVVMRSPMAMEEVVTRSHAETNYMVKNNLRYDYIYGPTLPIEINFLDIEPNGKAVARLTSSGDNKVSVSDFASDMVQFEEVPDRTSIEVDLSAQNDTIDSPLGRMVLTRNEAFKGDASEAFNIIANRIGIGSAVSFYLSSLKIEVKDNYSSVLYLSLNDYNPDRANVVLGNLIDVYNENWVKDRNQMAISTYNFINERLGVIEEELGDVDTDISKYKSENQITTAGASSQIYLNRSMDANDKAMALRQDLQQARDFKNQLSNLSRQYEVLPAFTGLSINLENLIIQYNEKIKQRANLLTNTSEDHYYIQDLNAEISTLRQSMIAAIDQHISQLNSEMNYYTNMAGTSSSKLAANPTQEKNLLGKERQQKVKEELYLYLLQKREENELSQAFSAYNSKLLSPPSATGPINIGFSHALMIAIGVGFLFPALIIYLIEMFNSKVRGRKDIEHLTIPFVGEIPLATKKNKGFKKLFKKREKIDDHKLLVKKGSGNVINEAFRVIRTNMEFMLPTTAHQTKSIMITSANPGSGKTFITLNLAAVLSLKGKRVIMLDLDLRKATLSDVEGSYNMGLSNYLTGQISDLNEILVRNVAELENVDLLPVGPIPPNPAELLYSERLVSLIDMLKKEYDYVLIDCPPIEVVADAKIINRLVDVTLFIIRAGVLEREMLPEIQRFYDIKRYNNMAVILNGTPDPSQSTFKRANRFGYGYGYGYGYYKKK